MNYVVSCLTSLQPQCMLELLALPVEIRSKSQADGFTTIVITAAMRSGLGPPTRVAKANWDGAGQPAE